MKLTPAMKPLTLAAAAGLLAVAASDAAAQQRPPPVEIPETSWQWDPDDPRIGLEAGVFDAGEAIDGLSLLISMPKPDAFLTEEADGRGPTNSDIAFLGDYMIQGSYWGFQIYDVSDPAEPELTVSVVCPGGQGDVSVHGHLLFTSVQQSSARQDCGTEGVEPPVSGERLMGIRIFDLSDVSNPRQVKTVQTCRGSHTHTLVTHPDADDRVWIYVSGTGRVRPAEELDGCVAGTPDEEPGTALFRIEVIEVPLAMPEDARIVSAPRIFADPETGEIAGLWPGGDHGPMTQRSRVTNQCHDITVRPDLGLAAGACSGNGILLDISDPANPVRIDQVADPNFAYWHSATFNNDGTAIVFTDEWGGGGAPRCRSTDPDTWGANAIFRVRDRKMELAGYYKLPVPQTEQENCVAHNGSLIPVPGRDIMVQAWYQGGISVFDFTDPANAHEIGYFDRGPLDPVEMLSGGYWSAYWHNGAIYGAEMARGIDVLALAVGEHLSEAEIEAARSVRMNEFNAQTQPLVEWPATVPVARSYLEQMQRSGGIGPEAASATEELLEMAETGSVDGDAMVSLADQLESTARSAENARGAGDARRLRMLADTLRGIAAGG